jgi:hypothetical protein
MTLPIAPATDIALELERLRGTMSQGFAQMDTKFAEVNGKLNMLGERTERTDAEVTALDVRVSSLEKRVWMSAGAAAFIGMAAPYVAAALSK